MAVHSELPPSASDQWLNCLGWLNAVKHIKQPPSSKFADEGTAAHEVLELALMLDSQPEEVCSDAEMAEGVGYVTDWVATYLVLHPNTQYESEYWVPWGVSVGYPLLGGTSDVVMANDDELVVIDLKYGAGIIVEPDAEQMFCYMVGLRAIMGKRKSYRNVIIQPRARHIDGPVFFNYVTTAEIYTFNERLLHAVQTNYKGTAPRTAGDHCRWCRAAPTCKTFASKAISIAISEFSIEQIIHPDDGSGLIE